MNNQLTEALLLGNGWEEISAKLNNFQHVFVKKFVNNSDYLYEDSDERFWRYDPSTKDFVEVTALCD